MANDEHSKGDASKRIQLTFQGPSYSTWEEYTIEAVYQDRSPETPYVGKPGFYNTTATLAPPGNMVFSNGEKGVSNLEGSSLLVGSPNKSYEIEIHADKSATNIIDIFRLNSNSDGVLKNVHARFWADNLESASNLGIDEIQTYLSWLSFQHDVGIEVSQYLTVEEKTVSGTFLSGFSGPTKNFIDDGNEDLVPSTHEYRLLFSAYREALNSTNVFYRFLSFYRVAEGVRNLRSSHKSSKNNLNHVSEKIPDDLTSLVIADKDRNLDRFAPFKGKKFTRILDHDLRVQMRNAIAHIDPKGSYIIGDQSVYLKSCISVLPVIHHIARTMLKNYIESNPDFHNTIIL